MFRIIFYIATFAFMQLSFAFAESQEITITLKDHKFHPDIVFAKAGQKIKLIVRNEDDMVEEFESNDLKREKIIPPGGSINLILAPLKPGEYKFFGEFHEETAQGKLVISDEGKADTTNE